jgi:hypothetical protein
MLAARAVIPGTVGLVLDKRILPSTELRLLRVRQDLTAFCRDGTIRIPRQLADG